MRDQTIEAAFRRFQEAVEHDVANLTKQNALNRARIYAVERVLFGRRWFLLKAILLSLISPKKLKDRINLAHAAEVADFNREMERRYGANNNGKFKVL